MTLNVKTVAFINEHFGGKHKKNKQKGGVKRILPTIIIISMALWLEMMFAWERNIQFNSIKVLHEILISSGTPMRELVVEAAQGGWVRTVMERFHIETWLLKDGKEMPYDVNTCGDIHQNIEKYLGFWGTIGYPTTVRELRPEIGDGMGHTIGNCEEEAMQATIFAWNIISLIIPIILTSGLWFIAKNLSRNNENTSSPNQTTITNTTVIGQNVTPFTVNNQSDSPLQLSINEGLRPAINLLLENPHDTMQRILSSGFLGQDLSKRWKVWSQDTLTQYRQINTNSLQEIQTVMNQIAPATNRNGTRNRVDVNIWTFVAQPTVNGWIISPCQGNREIVAQCLRIFALLRGLYVERIENSGIPEVKYPGNFILAQLQRNKREVPLYKTGPGPDIQVVDDNTRRGGRKKKRKTKKKKKRRKTKKKAKKKRKTKKKKKRKTRFSGKESYCRCIRAKKKQNKTKKNGYVSYCRCFEVA